MIQSNALGDKVCCGGREIDGGGGGGGGRGEHKVVLPFRVNFLYYL